MIKKIVGMIKENPPIPNTNPIPGLSKIAVVSNNEVTNTGTLQIKNLKSFRRNGRVKINIIQIKHKIILKVQI